ncbi:MAG: hypothetical protein H8E17_11050 [Deltaproteobacteria bacterium]|nr:hypothetical protein [Deltaproteobacteria bacterium]
MERELITLAKKAYEAPARLLPSDLDPIRDIAGDGALDYALVLGSFHYINRIADLLQVSPEALPASLRRFEFLRRITIRVAGFMMAKMNLANRTYPVNFEEAVEKLKLFFENTPKRRLEDELESLKTRPKLVEVLQLKIEDRDRNNSLNREILTKIHRTVEAALPAVVDEAEGFHTHPEDPVEAFAFVGTRYAYRVTEHMIDTLRQAGYDDTGILDLAIAVADANQWARIHRLAGLHPDLFYIGTG